jgi:hypothetical protein
LRQERHRRPGRRTSRAARGCTCGAMRTALCLSSAEPDIIQKPRSTKPEMLATAKARWAYFRGRYMGSAGPARVVGEVTYGLPAAIWHLSTEVIYACKSCQELRRECPIFSPCPLCIA